MGSATVLSDRNHQGAARRAGRLAGIGFRRGYWAWRSDVDAIHAEIDAAAVRFAALSPEEQRAWLETHRDALRSGELSLEDLP